MIVGNGNVALDCCRILLSSPDDRLMLTDIPLSILEVLKRSQIRTVTIVGRRGPLEVYSSFFITFRLQAEYILVLNL